ncbi:MAG: error-prone DNA polymerase [Burkholderiaceae bacterium]|nr:error-prone DNA polymerase [Burkholderiaceae bacterium]
MSPLLPGYAELQCASNFSFLRGASHPEQLVARAAELGYSAIAITDECSVAGVVRAHSEAKRQGLALIIGSQFRVIDATGAALRLIALAMNRDGYGNLCELITLARSRADKGDYLLYTHDFTQPLAALAHVRGLPNCIMLLAPGYCIAPDVLRQQLDWMRHTFGPRARVALNLLYRGQDEQHKRTVQQIGAEQGIPVVATGDVCMHLRSRKRLQDVLSAIQLGKPVAQCGRGLFVNAEQHLRSRLRLANLYPAETLAESVAIAAQCDFSLDQLRYEYPDELVPAGYTPSSYLREQTWLGAQRRFTQGIPPEVQQQLTHELQLIAEMQYEPYFLTVYDIVSFARSRHILCQGRGSAANSAVCYCLGITEVDPARGNLLFERFISKERNEPPDIDVDFEHQRREEVIQYIYDKYGRERAALTGVVISYRPRSAIRDTGKALGIDAHIIDQLAKSQRWWDRKENLRERFTECGLDPDSVIAQHWHQIALELMGFPRHLSQHPGGFVIARDKLSRLVPIEKAAMQGRSVVQWDKDDLDALGLLKIDILALGMLSALRRGLEFISQQQGEPFELADIPAEDAATYDMISRADTVGVFQIESRAQMSMLPRLKPRTFYDLVIEVAIIRPGPIQGGMIHPYLRRRQGREAITYPSEDVKAALSRTLGVPIFQEQVMQLAMLAAGFSAGEADQLRRAMAAWKRKGGLEKFHDKLINGMLARGYQPEFAEALFSQIEGFAEYGFPESHAASFALLAYASAWMKCHHPAAFLAALLNSQPMGFYSASQLVQDARRHGVEIRPVDVMHSDWEATLEPGDSQAPAVRLGLNRVHGLTQMAGWRIEEARAVKDFSDLNDLAMRAGLSATDLQALAAANALQSIAGHRREALWHAVAATPGKGLLKTASTAIEPIQLPAPSEAQQIIADYRSIGLTLGRHPLALLRTHLLKRRLLPANTLATFKHGQIARACGIVTVRQRPATAKGTVFVTLEDETGTVNVIVWPALIERQRRELLQSSLLAVYGIWQTDNSVNHLIAKRLVDLSDLLGRLQTSSRNFC